MASTSIGRRSSRCCEYLSIPLVAVLLDSGRHLSRFAGEPLAGHAAGAATALLLHGIVRLIGGHHVQAADLACPARCGGLLSRRRVLGVRCWAVRRSGRWAWVAVTVLPLAAAVVLWPEHALVTPGNDGGTPSMWVRAIPARRSGIRRDELVDAGGRPARSRRHPRPSAV